MTLVKFNRPPFEGSFNNLVDGLFAGFPVHAKSEFQQAWKGSVPVNIKETEKSYQLEIVAPGFEKNDFKISLDGQILTVSVEKENEVKADAGNNGNDKHIRREYSYRSFKRSFTLNEKTNADGIDAKYVNGVLTLNLAKKEEVKPSVQQISIQ
jgi:HSP20 family protein